MLFAAYDADDTRDVVRTRSLALASPVALLNDADADCVERIRTGDRAAFDALFLELFPGLCRFAARYTDETSAAEVVSEAFLRLWLARERWTPRGSVRAYLYRTVRFIAIDFYRANHAEDVRYSAVLGADETWGMAAEIPTPDVALERDATIALVWNAIARLTDVQQSVMALRWQAQLPWDEIAAILGMSSVAVRKQHSRALAALRTILPAHLTDD